MRLDPRIPPGPLAQKWDRHKFDLRLVSPANKRTHRVLVVGVYVFANLLLAWHLSHGIASLFQSLGVRSQRFTPMIEAAGLWVSALIGAGFISIPISVRLGLVSLPGGAG